MHTLGGPATTINNYQPWTFLNHFNIGKFNPDLFGFISFLIRISFDKTLQISSKGSAVCDWLSHPLPNYAKLMFANESFNDTWIPKENLLILSRGNKSWHFDRFGGFLQTSQAKTGRPMWKEHPSNISCCFLKRNLKLTHFPMGYPCKVAKTTPQKHSSSCWIMLDLYYPSVPFPVGTQHPKSTTSLTSFIFSFPSSLLYLKTHKLSKIFSHMPWTSYNKYIYIYTHHMCIISPIPLFPSKTKKTSEN